MPLVTDITGQRFGRLVALSREAGPSPSRWACVCDCGVTKTIDLGGLTSGKVKSCGCLKAQVTGLRNRVHGLSDHPLYEVWSAIKDRCLRPDSPQFKDYGGRGITVCEEWMHDGAAFINWAESNGYRPGLLIDREDNDGGYSPDNCRFVTRKVSNGNRRNNHYVETQLGRMTISEAVDASGLTRGTIRRRIKLGWPASRMLQPPRKMMKQETSPANRGNNGE